MSEEAFIAGIHISFIESDDEYESRLPLQSPRIPSVSPPRPLASEIATNWNGSAQLSSTPETGQALSVPSLP